jgi:hypothetical protein
MKIIFGKRNFILPKKDKTKNKTCELFFWQPVDKQRMVQTTRMSHVGWQAKS